ncbi:MAG: serine/threonine-protein kinase [Pseudomonadota bacterium]
MMQDKRDPTRSRSGLEPGTILNNNFRIEKQLGEGGMGAVYLACNTFLEEDCVAIKVIRSEQAHDELVREMFAKEVRAMVRLQNPRLVSYRTFAHDADLDLNFIVTEFIDGPSLEALLKQGRRFSTDELLTLITEICIGLRAAHKAGVVHRDLAPDNILLEDGDLERPKIIDFGIVKDARQGATIIGTGFAGKLNFVAPEQLGEPEYEIGPWTDIYSLALVILGMARGKEVDMGSTPGAAIRNRLEPIDLSALAPELRLLLAAMLAVHPDQRLRSTEEVMVRVEAIQRGDVPGNVVPETADKTIWMPEGAAPAQINALSKPLPVEEDEPVEELDDEVADDNEEWDDDEEYEEYHDEEQSDGGGLWVLLVIMLLTALAVIAGVYFGEFASVPEDVLAEME